MFLYKHHTVNIRLPELTKWLQFVLLCDTLPCIYPTRIQCQIFLAHSPHLISGVVSLKAMKSLLQVWHSSHQLSPEILELLNKLFRIRQLNRKVFSRILFLLQVFIFLFSLLLNTLIPHQYSLTSPCIPITLLKTVFRASLLAFPSQAKIFLQIAIFNH